MIEGLTLLLQLDELPLVKNEPNRDPVEKTTGPEVFLGGKVK